MLDELQERTEVKYLAGISPENKGKEAWVSAIVRGGTQRPRSSSGDSDSDTPESSFPLLLSYIDGTMDIVCMHHNSGLYPSEIGVSHQP